MLRDREGNGAVLSGTGVGKLSTTLQAAGEGWGGMGKVFFTELQSAGVPLRAVPLRCLQPREGRESEIGPCSRSLWGDRCLSVIGAVLTLVWV